MNIITLDISNGILNHEIGAGEYVKLISAPTAANVTIKSNEPFKKGIPLQVGHSLRARKEVRNIYVSADAVAGATITIMQADNNDDFELDTPPTSIDVDTISTIGDRFRPDGSAIQQSIVAGGSYIFTKTNETMIRFHSTDETGVELNANGIKYPMFEDELRINNITTVKFHNNTAATIVVTLWKM